MRVSAKSHPQRNELLHDDPSHRPPHPRPPSSFFPLMGALRQIHGVREARFIAALHPFRRR